LTLAIIGGIRALSAVSCSSTAILERFGHALLPIAVHSPGHVAATDAQAQEELWPHYRAMMTRIGAERGWPPVDALRTSTARPDRTARCASDRLKLWPEDCEHRSRLGLSRFDMKYSAGTLSHHLLMSSIELFGTKVVPRVRNC
jgi:hypothetical protein